MRDYDPLHEGLIVLEQKQMEFMASELTVLGFLFGVAKLAPFLEKIEPTELVLAMQESVDHWNKIPDGVVDTDASNTYVSQIGRLIGCNCQDRFLLDKVLLKLERLLQPTIGKFSRPSPWQRHSGLGARTGSQCHQGDLSQPIKLFGVEHDAALVIGGNIRKNASALGQEPIVARVPCWGLNC